MVKYEREEAVKDVITQKYDAKIRGKSMAWYHVVILFEIKTKKF